MTYIAFMPLDTLKIRRLREQQGMTLDEAAKRAGFKTRQSWYSIESGGRRKVTPDTLQSLARALGVRMEDLMTVSGKRTSSARRKV